RAANAPSFAIFMSLAKTTGPLAALTVIVQSITTSSPALRIVMSWVSARSSPHAFSATIRAYAGPCSFLRIALGVIGVLDQYSLPLTSPKQKYRPVWCGWSAGSSLLGWIG